MFWATFKLVRLSYVSCTYNAQVNAQFPLLRSELRLSMIEVLRKTVYNRGVLGYVKASTTIARLLYEYPR